MGIKVYATLFTIFTLYFNLFKHVSGDINSSPFETITEKSEEIAYQKLLKMEKGMKDSIKKLVDQALPMLMNSNSSIELSAPCMGSVLKMIGALKKMRLWPFERTSSSFGSYQQCIDIVIPTYSKTRKPDVGQYCVIDLSVPLPPKPYRNKVGGNVFPHINATFETELMKKMMESLPLLYVGKYNWGICLPSACTLDDLNKILPAISSQMGFEASVKSCEIKEPFKMDTLQTVIASIIILFVLVNIVSTIFHEIQLFRSKHNQEKLIKGFWFKAARYFSARQNFINLFRTREANPRSLDALNGIKVITMTWIVLCHGYITKHPNLMREMVEAIEFLKDFAFQIMLNGYLSVSSFFFLTAVLVAYNTVKRQKDGKSLNPLIMFVRRIYRITPTMILAGGFAILRPLFASGPLYKYATTELADRCRDNWWKNLLFINNFFELDHQCEIYSWYLAVDIQCFIFGLIYLIVLFKSEVTAKLLLVVGIIGSTAAIGYVTYVNDYPPVYLFTFVDKEFVLDFNKKRYQATYSYLGLYCVGLYLGTYMAQASKIQIKKSIAIICWIAAFAVGLTIVYAIKPWTGDQPYTMLEAICYSSLNRLGWGIALGWVILACFSGRGGVINDLLSWPGFQPLVRLAYIVYLTHCQVFLTYNYSLQGPQDASHITIVFDSLACLCISHIIAVFVRVIFEYPLLKIEDDVFKQFELRHAKKPEGGDTTIDLHNRIALNDDVNLIKVTNNQIQFANEYGKRNQNERTDKEVEETSLETN